MSGLLRILGFISVAFSPLWGAIIDGSSELVKLGSSDVTAVTLQFQVEELRPRELVVRGETFTNVLIEG
ncbi:MAG: hypothetical protein ACK4OO_06335, partial [bacterium]